MFQIGHTHTGKWVPTTRRGVSGKFETRAEAEQARRAAGLESGYEIHESVAGPPLTSQEHYLGLNPEPIDVIEGWGLDFRLGSALAYIARAGRKPGAGNTAADDLRKAVTYLERSIAACEGRRAWK